MTEELLAELLAAVRAGALDVESALERLRGFPVDASVAGARVDTHRKLRTGAAEVVFCPGKTPGQVAEILARLHAHHGRALGTRATPELARQVRERLPEAAYDPVSRLLTLGWRPAERRSGTQPPAHRGAGPAEAAGQLDRNGPRAPSVAGGESGTGARAARGSLPREIKHPRFSPDGESQEHGEEEYGTPSAASDSGARGAEYGEAGGGSGALAAVVTGGTSDLPVAEEAAQTLEFLGGRVERCYDVGVAGLHRLLAVRPQLEHAAVVICVAGMEGALTSVVGGLLAAPVIGVPTSVGYGAHLGGVAPLLAMLNSCAAGVAVVNIDNGFGAALMAHAIIRQIDAAADSAPSSRRPRPAVGAAPVSVRDRRSGSGAQEYRTSPDSGSRPHCAGGQPGAPAAGSPGGQPTTPAAAHCAGGQPPAGAAARRPGGPPPASPAPPRPEAGATPAGKS